jgi:DNA polymerase
VTNYKNSILEIKKNCYSCTKCPLGKNFVDGLDPHVFACGKVPSEIIFIAEAAGKEEQIQKTPLVGRSGQFFNEYILERANIKRCDIYITNAVLCRPRKNRTPLPAEIETCRQHLDAQICLLKPKLLVTMGNVPLYSVCECTGIKNQRGKVRWSREWSNSERVSVLPIFHPAYCLRGSGLSEMAADSLSIKLLKEVIDLGRYEILDRLANNNEEVTRENIQIGV